MLTSISKLNNIFLRACVMFNSTIGTQVLKTRWNVVNRIKLETGVKCFVSDLVKKASKPTGCVVKRRTTHGKNGYFGKNTGDSANNRTWL